MSPTDHSFYCKPNYVQNFNASKDRSNLLKSLVSKINDSYLEVKAIRGKIFSSTEKMLLIYGRREKTNEKMNFYTRISSSKFFTSVSLSTTRLQYWRGPKPVQSYSRMKRNFTRPSSKNLKITYFL